MLSKSQLEKFEKRCLVAAREALEGRDTSAVRDRWKEPFAMKPHFFDEKTLLLGFSHGLEEAHRWQGEYKELPGLAGVKIRIYNEIELLRFGFDDGKIRMSLYDLIDKHFRLWMKDNDQIQQWIGIGLITPRAVLANSTNYFMIKRDYFDEAFIGFVTELKQRLKDAKKEGNAEQVFRDFLKEIGEIKEEEKPSEQKLPSGFMPKI